MNPKVLVICGPTATGKTKLAVALARSFGGELVSADSRQVYRGMDIATGKDLHEVRSMPLWMIDQVNPDQEFSVSQYVVGAQKAIEDIHERGKLPILVGGTGFYIQALTHPLDTIDVAPNVSLREELKHASVAELTKRLIALDAHTWKDMNASDRVNPRRLIRRIEILSSRSKAPSVAHVKRYDALTIGLTASNEKLYQRIDRRVDARMKAGVLDEVKLLVSAGYAWDLPSMSGLGYRQWYGYFTVGVRERAVLLPSIIQQWKYDEHRYARRQMTWFRKMEGIAWFDTGSSAYTIEVEQKVRAWYTENRDLA